MIIRADLRTCLGVGSTEYLSLYLFIGEQIDNPIGVPPHHHIRVRLWIRQELALRYEFPIVYPTAQCLHCSNIV